jgi:FKBP-type peptidyl-prolyl cis-trans isomerase (trigger factor)
LEKLLDELLEELLKELSEELLEELLEKLLKKLLKELSKELLEKLLEKLLKELLEELLKKLLGLEIEKQCDNMIALAPKMYSCSNGTVSTATSSTTSASPTVISKCKGYRNNKLKFDDYNTIVVKKQSLTSTNHSLQLHKGQMSMTTVGKNVLTASHTKYCVSGDFSTCYPLFVGC